ncbi:MAG: DNA replication and repair protein RecF, partial [Clostridiales bacterium]|nr:DNA replication and repair protein RecF [Clostridiales bacterium]
ELCQLDKVYLHNLTNYNKILVQRNNLLKQISFNSNLLDTLSIWDKQLVKYGISLIERRSKFIKQLNEIVYGIHKKLSGGNESLILKYEPNVTVEDFENRLLSVREKELRTQVTSIGPHRDDMDFLIGDIDLRKFGSQGQQRTCALSVKLAEIELVKKVINNKPVLLLDDVLSELDSKRQNYLLESIDGIQTILTCTGLDEFVNSRIEFNKVYHIVKGTAKKIVS